MTDTPEAPKPRRMAMREVIRILNESRTFADAAAALGLPDERSARMLALRLRRQLWPVNKRKAGRKPPEPKTEADLEREWTFGKAVGHE